MGNFVSGVEAAIKMFATVGGIAIGGAAGRFITVMLDQHEVVWVNVVLVGAGGIAGLIGGWRAGQFLSGTESSGDKSKWPGGFELPGFLGGNSLVGGLLKTIF